MAFGRLLTIDVGMKSRPQWKSVSFTWSGRQGEFRPNGTKCMDAKSNLPRWHHPCGGMACAVVEKVNRSPSLCVQYDTTRDLYGRVRQEFLE